ncbi:MAG: hypothetical protein WAN12_14050 [Candidatus Acidiferrum sp.]
MLHSKLFLCADSASIDSRNNAVSAFHIAEGSNAAVFPVAVPRFTVIALLSREEADPVEFNIQLQASLGGQQLFSGPFPVNFAGGLLGRTIVELQGLVIPGPGDLTFLLRIEDQVLASWVIKVSQVGQPQMQLLLPQAPPA